MFSGLSPIKDQNTGKEYIHSFVVNRKTWSHGDPDGSFLLSPYDGKQCCVGFFMSSLGHDDSNLRGNSTLGYVIRNTRYEDLYQEVFPKLSERVLSQLYLLNDSPSDNPTFETVRETSIKEKFSSAGILVEFVN